MVARNKSSQSEMPYTRQQTVEGVEKCVDDLVVPLLGLVLDHAQAERLPAARLVALVVFQQMLEQQAGFLSPELLLSLAGRLRAFAELDDADMPCLAVIHRCACLLENVMRSHYAAHQAAAACLPDFSAN